MSKRTYDVIGPAPFPIDMLRHDECWPTTSEDAVMVQTASVRDSVSINKRFRISITSGREPTPSRWGKFGWGVRRAQQGY
jgi:hypothetical protein